MDRLEYTGNFKIPDRDSQLRVKIEPAYRQSDMEQVMRFSLTVTGMIKENFTDWMLSARATIVRSFAKFTTIEAHKAWGEQT